MEITIKWQKESNDWKNIDTDELLHMSIRHSCNLFSNTKIPIVVKQDDFYIVNTENLKERYRKTGKLVFTFQSILNHCDKLADQLLSVKGFMISGINHITA